MFVFTVDFYAEMLYNKFNVFLFSINKSAPKFVKNFLKVSYDKQQFTQQNPSVIMS